MSNPIPNLLALTTIADGSQRLAAPLRNNYTAIQTAFNGIIAALSGGAAGEVLVATDATDVGYAFPPGHEFAYAQKSTDTIVSATSAPSANVVATTGSVAYDGATVVMIEVSCFASVRGTNWIRGVIYMDGAVLQDFAFYNATGTVPSTGRFRYTPAAGAHTFGFAAYVDAGSGAIDALNGAPAYIRVTKAA